LENVVESALETLGPNMRAGSRVDQLAGDAHPLSGLAYTAFENVAHAEFPPNLAQVG